MVTRDTAAEELVDGLHLQERRGSRFRMVTTTPTIPPSLTSRPLLTAMSLHPTETPTRRMTNVSLYCILTLIIAHISYSDYLSSKKDTELSISSIYLMWLFKYRSYLLLMKNYCRRIKLENRNYTLRDSKHPPGCSSLLYPIPTHFIFIWTNIPIGWPIFILSELNMFLCLFCTTNLYFCYVGFIY